MNPRPKCFPETTFWATLTIELPQAAPAPLNPSSVPCDFVWPFEVAKNWIKLKKIVKMIFFSNFYQWLISFGGKKPQKSTKQFEFFGRTESKKDSHKQEIYNFAHTTKKQVIFGALIVTSRRCVTIWANKKHRVFYVFLMTNFFLLIFYLLPRTIKLHRTVF